MTTYKGTDKDMKCRGLQYELGVKQADTGAIRCGNNGFHSCEIPMDTLSYYKPGEESRYFECEASGIFDKSEDEDSKIASSEITLKTEIGLTGLIKAQIEYVKKIATRKAAQGDGGHAAAQGYRGHAAAQGNRGHAAAQGNWGHAEVHGKNAIAASFGVNGTVLGELGDWLVLAEWAEKDGNWELVCVKSAFIDGEIIKPRVRYRLTNGQFVEAAE